MTGKQGDWLMELWRQAEQALTIVVEMNWSLSCPVRAVSQSTFVYSSTVEHVIGFERCCNCFWQGET